MLEEIHSTPRGAAWGGQGRGQRERQDVGHRPLLGSAGGVLWVPGLKPDWSIQTNESGALVSSPGVLSKGRTGEGPWEAGRLLVTRLLGESYQKLTFACIPAGCYLGHAPV